MTFFNKIEFKIKKKLAKYVGVVLITALFYSFVKYSNVSSSNKELNITAEIQKFKSESEENYKNLESSFSDIDDDIENHGDICAIFPSGIKKDMALYNLKRNFYSHLKNAVYINSYSGKYFGNEAHLNAKAFLDKIDSEKSSFRSCGKLDNIVLNENKYSKNKIETLQLFSKKLENLRKVQNKIGYFSYKNDINNNKLNNISQIEILIKSCVIRPKAATESGPKRPVNPLEGGH